MVSGLPRSGTSMMMRMLEAGGVPPVQDGVRAADTDNPRGYYEHEGIKRLDRDDSWLDGCDGQAVKVISYLLPRLPDRLRYRVIFMRRDLDEVLASQQRMLAHRGTQDAADDAAMRRDFVLHVADTERWLRAAPNVESLYVSYNRTLAEPAAQIARVAAFAGPGLDEGAMRAVVEPGLYRNRG